MNIELDIIQAEIAYVQELFSLVVKIVPRFNIADPRILPYGLKPHTRSVSWIVEQVVVQQAKFNSGALGLQDVKIDLPDTCLHDCELIRNDGRTYYVNVKITSAGTKRSKNDIAAVEKLYMQYSANPDYRIVYVVFGSLLRTQRLFSWKIGYMPFRHSFFQFM